jgi:osmotically-inducible protein OsmY
MPRVPRPSAFFAARAASVARKGSHRGRRFARHAYSEVAGRTRRLANSVSHETPDLDDATLAHKVESILFRDREVPKGRINVNAENGVVFLRGEVDGPDLLQTLENRVGKVKGVKGVENLLHLPGQPPPDR